MQHNKYNMLHLLNGGLDWDRDDALGEEQYEQLLQAADPKRPEELLILLLAGELGMREDEIAHLQRSWLNYQKGQIIIPSISKDGWTPKTRWGARTISALTVSKRSWDAIKGYFTIYEKLAIPLHHGL